MTYLGVSPTHDSSVCVFDKNKILYFSKEERKSKIKRDREPILSFIHSLNNYEIKKIVWCPPYEQIWFPYINLIKKIKKNNIEIIDLYDKHHLQHASLAFYNSGFKNASIIVIDRNGSLIENCARESETIFFAQYPCDFKEIYKSFWVFNNVSSNKLSLFKKENPDCEIDTRSMLGITKVYETATNLIGQNVLENGKTMGLSSYGKENKNFPNLFFNNIPQDYYFSHCEEENMPAIFLDLNDKKTQNITKNNYQIYADYSYQVQKQTQEAVCHLIQKSIDKNKCKNICITGGYGLNVVANQYYISQFPDVNFYFEPLADDSGNSIGGAMLAYRMDTQDKTISKIKNTFFQGEKYDIRKVYGKKISIKEVSDILQNKKSLGIYYKLAESGPRALGHRSIFFDARNPNAKELINRVKNREWYRPFAGIMLEEDAEKYFYINDKNNYEFMTVNFYAKDIAKKEIPGILHVDNTCRIQVIKNTSEPAFQLLKQFKKDTGVGVLLNTSFNLSGMPLVETPDDALKMLNGSSLDYVWFPETEILT
jgi:carbamoyltransferase